ncbi:hypothetical protein JCM3774_001743 [Rhodotorula dairenensis]
MASAVASTSAYVFPPTTDPPPPPPAPPHAAAPPPVPSQQPLFSFGAHGHEPPFDYVRNAYSHHPHGGVEDRHVGQGGGDGDYRDDFDELGSEPEEEDGAALSPPKRKRRRAAQISAITLGSDDAPGLSGGRLKRFMCSYPGCGKCYTRPIRLEEHQRSHTGERPFKCPDCDATFQRDSHLKAHARSHLSDSDKRYPCGLCEKRFWTNQHVKKHVEMVHNSKGYDCPDCGQHFRKHRGLRDHLAQAHAPPGTKPFICEHPGCTQSFKQMAHLKSHAKTHDLSRYACLNPLCADRPVDQRQFGTWSELQRHNKNVHPPTCPYPECNNQTFTTKRGLRGHLDTHDKRAAVRASGGVPRGPVIGGDTARRKRVREAQRQADPDAPAGPTAAVVALVVPGVPGVAAMPAYPAMPRSYSHQAWGVEPETPAPVPPDESESEVDQLADDYAADYDDDDGGVDDDADLEAPGLSDNEGDAGGRNGGGGDGGHQYGFGYGGYPDVIGQGPGGRGEAPADQVEGTREWEARQEQERDDRMREDFRHGGKKKRRVLLEAAGFPPLSYALPPPPPPPRPLCDGEPAAIAPPSAAPASKYLDLVTGANYAVDPHAVSAKPASGAGLPVDSAVILNGPPATTTSSRTSPTRVLVRKYACPFPAILSMPHKELVPSGTDNHRQHHQPQHDYDHEPNNQDQDRERDDPGEEEGPAESGGLCRYWFKRVYDVERHLRARHGVEMDGGREVLDAWFQADRTVTFVA